MLYMGEFLLNLKKKRWHFCSTKKGKSNYILETLIGRNFFRESPPDLKQFCAGIQNVLSSSRNVSY